MINTRGVEKCMGSDSQFEVNMENIQMDCQHIIVDLNILKGG